MSVKEPRRSRLFIPFRTLGLCSNEVPLCTHYNAKQRETYVITCVGRAFHSYKTSNFGLTWISDVHKTSITTIAADDYYVFTACDNLVTAFYHGGKTGHTFSGHNFRVIHLLPVSGYLVSVDTMGFVKIWKISTEELYGEITIPPEKFEITTLCHPVTYTNKVLLGSEQGTLELWNIRTMKQLYGYEGWSSPVTVTEQSPAVDVIAVGLASGDIVLHNVKTDESLFKFKHDDGPIASITFRTDEGSRSIMLSGSTYGHIGIWDLEKRRIIVTMRNAHAAVVSGLRCINGEPLVVSSSPDNSIKLWLFDQPNGSGRLLRERSGHSAPLTDVMFHRGETMRNNPDNTTSMITSSLDGSLRVFSTFSDADNRSLGQGSFNKKQMKKSKGEKRERYVMPPIVQIASEPTRQGDWDCIVCCHESLPFATSWDLGKFTMGKHRFSHIDHENIVNNGINSAFDYGTAISSLNKTEATACAITPCGNFALIGFSSGHVDIFNMQSGIYRGTFSLSPKEKPVPPTHVQGAVRGIAVDATNTIVVTADGSSKGILMFWKFRSRHLIGSLEMDAPISKIRLCRGNSLLAVALDDFRLCVVDIELRRVVRRLSPGHSAPITDLTFSSDGRWLISSSMDTTMRTWDLPSSNLVDCFVASSKHPPLAIAMSPVGEFLASIHRDQMGISLWTNRSLYDFVSLHPPLTQAEVDKILQNSQEDLPSAESDDALVEITDSAVDDSSAGDQVLSVNTDLMKLSLEPETKWFSLFNLDLIKEKNKPKLPPQKPVNVPFFLPTVPGLDPRLDVPEKGEELAKNGQKNLASLPLSTWTSDTWKAEVPEDFKSQFQKLKKLGPSGVDLELRLVVESENDSDFKLTINFLRCIKYQLEACRDFDLAVAYLARYLKLEGQSITKKPLILQILSQELVPIVVKKWDRVRAISNRSLAVISFAKAPLVL